MRRELFAPLALLAAIGIAAPAWAADHRDGAEVKKDPATDINDVYAWMNGDATKLWLVMTVSPFAMAGAKFSDSAKYVFNMHSKASITAMPMGQNKIVCTFKGGEAKTGECWLLDAAGKAVDYVTGDLSGVAGVDGVNKKMKVFAGLRSDPFFFNLKGFQALAGTVKAAAGGLMFDGAGCPKIDMATSGALVGALKSDGMGKAGADDFKGANTLAIVVVVDKTAINGGGNVVGVWGSTNK